MKSKAEQKKASPGCQSLAKVDRPKTVKPPQQAPALWMAHPARQKLADWLSTPRSGRQPATMTALAKELGYRLETLSRWRSRREMILEVVGRVRATNADRLPRIVESIAERAEAGDTTAAKLFLSFVYGWCERAQIALQASMDADLPDMGGSGDPFAEEPMRPEELPTWARQEIEAEEAAKRQGMQ